MTDSRLRELERRWQETGSVEDEAAYLLEKVRRGDLNRRRLESAAMLNHPAACRALDQPPHKGISWIYALEGHGQEAYVRAWLPVAKLIKALIPDFGFCLDDAFDIAEQWCQHPNQLHQSTARNIANKFNIEALRYEEIESLVIRSAAFAARLTHLDEQSSSSEMICLLSEIQTCILGVVRIMIHQNIMDNYIPWLLGYYDPLVNSPQGKL